MFNAADATEVYVVGSPTDFPEYNKNLTVNIKVYDAPEKGIILVNLSSKSSMVGRCTNYPVNDTGNTNDIQLHASLNSGWTDAGTGVLRYEFTRYYKDFDVPLLVTTYDSGAWGILSAEVYEKKDGSSPKRKAKNTGTVPRDENNNHIADGWKSDFYPYKYKNKDKQIVNVGATRKQKGIKDYPYSKPLLKKRQNTVDAEGGPQTNKENGDGFTVFEEYRGFMLMSVTSKVERFDPETKEVGIVLDTSVSTGLDTSTTTYGTGNVGYHPFHSFISFGGADYVSKPFGKVRDAATHELLSGGDVSDDIGQINTNSDGIPDTEYVYAVRVKDATVHPTNKGEMGRAPVYKPSKLSLVHIYTQAIKSFQQQRLPNYTVKQIVNHTTGHEVGHTINLKHCPTSCVNNTKTCMMRPSLIKRDSKGKIVENNVGASPSSYHHIDYDLAGSVKSPQPEAALTTNTSDADDKKKPKADSIKRSLSSASGSDTAEAGDSFTVNFSTSSPYSSVYWYVQSPFDYRGMPQEVDKGDGIKTTADFTYTFPTGVSADIGVSGNYIFSVDVYEGASLVYEESYTVSVSLPMNALTAPEASLTCGLTPPVPRDTAFGVSFTSVDPFLSARFYKQGPGDESETFSGSEEFYNLYPESGRTVHHSMSFSGNPGAWNVRVEVKPVTGDTYSVHFTIQVK